MVKENGLEILLEEIKLCFYTTIIFVWFWKSENVSFIGAKRELKENFKVVGNYITEENVNSHFIYICTLKKIESHLTNFTRHDLETHNTDSAICVYILSKLAGRYNRDLTPAEKKV